MRQMPLSDFHDLPSGTLGFDPQTGAFIRTNDAYSHSVLYLDHNFHYQPEIGEQSESTGETIVTVYDEAELARLRAFLAPVGGGFLQRHRSITNPTQWAAAVPPAPPQPPAPEHPPVGLTSPRLRPNPNPRSPKR